MGSAQEDLQACGGEINENIVMYHESKKLEELQGLNEDFMDRPVKCVCCVRCIRADCKPIVFITRSHLQNQQI